MKEGTTMNDNSLMKNLKRIRIEQDMSIETLSQQTGLTTDFLTKLESTPSSKLLDHEKLTAKQMFNIANLLKTTIADLLDRPIRMYVGNDPDSIPARTARRSKK